MQLNIHLVKHNCQIITTTTRYHGGVRLPCSIAGHSCDTVHVVSTNDATSLVSVHKCLGRYTVYDMPWSRRSYFTCPGWDTVYNMPCL